jgi:hypothetical protein
MMAKDPVVASMNLSTQNLHSFKNKVQGVEQKRNALRFISLAQF